MLEGRGVTQEASGIRVSVGKDFVQQRAYNQEVLFHLQGAKLHFSVPAVWLGTQTGFTQDTDSLDTVRKRRPLTKRKAIPLLSESTLPIPTTGFPPSLSHHLYHYRPAFTSSFCRNMNLPLRNQIQGYCRLH